jgi:hypothetical protein
MAQTAPKAAPKGGPMVQMFANAGEMGIVVPGLAGLFTSKKNPRGGSGSLLSAPAAATSLWQQHAPKLLY